MAAWFDGSDIKVEISFTAPTVAAVWTDVTGFVRGCPTVRPSSRTSELDQHQAGSMTVLLDNRARTFDPSYASNISPYVGNLLPMRPIRFSLTYAAVTKVQFSGFVRSWPQTWDISDKDSTVTIECVDLLTVLAMQRMPESWWAQEVRADSPYLWWRLGEQSGDVMTDSSGNQRNGSYQGGATFNTRVGLLAGSSDNAILFDRDVRARYQQGLDPTSTLFTCEFWLPQ